MQNSFNIVKTDPVIPVPQYPEDGHYLHSVNCGRIGILVHGTEESGEYNPKKNYFYLVQLDRDQNFKVRAEVLYSTKETLPECSLYMSVCIVVPDIADHSFERPISVTVPKPGPLHSKLTELSKKMTTMLYMAIKNLEAESVLDLNLTVANLAESPEIKAMINDLRNR